MGLKHPSKAWNAECPDQWQALLCLHRGNPAAVYPTIANDAWSDRGGLWSLHMGSLP